MDTLEKIRENRIRATAQRRGLVLQKSRRRDVHAIGYGRYQLIDASTTAVVSLGGRDGWMTLDQVETQLRLVIASRDPAVTRLQRAFVPLAIAMAPINGLDPRTMTRLASLVDIADKAMQDGTVEEFCAAIRGILDAPSPAPPDQLGVGPLLIGLRQALDAYRLSG
jgi:hypothetical protein